jgi:alpha-galactosidase
MMRKVGDVLISSGLASLGFVFINSDDCWQVDRHENGTIIADPVRFPYGIAATARYIQGLGLKFGLYTAAREYTCQDRPGSWRFEDTDIDTYCRWGIDYVKTDGCFGRGNAADNTTWIHFRAGIDRCVANGGRPMVLSVESCSDPTGCGVWLPKLANLWRTTGDIQATFASVLSNLDQNNKMAGVQRVGAWNDADLLQVGNAGLSPAEARSHFAAWAIIASPLLLSNDLASGLDADTLAILSAPEVIAVSQDPLGVQGVRVSPAAPAGGECWARPLADGGVAALLLNRGLAAASVSCSWAELGLRQPSASAAVRDLEARKDLGSFTGGFTASALAGHASMLVKVTQ